MRYPKRILSAIQLAKLFQKQDDPESYSLPPNEPWEGLIVRRNKNFTGFTVKNYSNKREVARINLLSRYGEAFTSFVCLVKPSTFQKKDLQCLPLFMDKPRVNEETPCQLITNNVYTKNKTTEHCKWYGGRGTRDDVGWIKGKQPFLIYDSKGRLLQAGKDDWFNPRHMQGEDNSYDRASIDARWLHTEVYPGMTAKKWYGSIWETLQQIKNCGVDARRMLILAAKTYTQVKIAAGQIPGAKINLVPMGMTEPEMPWSGSAGTVTAKGNHCLGTLRRDNKCYLPSIVVSRPKIIEDKEQRVLPYSVIDQDFVYDHMDGEVITIPPVGCTNLAFRSNTSIGTPGKLRKYYRDAADRKDKPTYEVEELDRLIARKDSGLTKAQYKDKYTPWCEPWRSFRALRPKARLKHDWVGYADTLDEDDFRGLLKQDTQGSLTMVQEQFIRAALWDFSQDDEHVAVMRLGEVLKNELPYAVKTSELCSNLVADALVNQLPLS